MRAVGANVQMNVVLYWGKVRKWGLLVFGVACAAVVRALSFALEGVAPGEEMGGAAKGEGAAGQCPAVGGGLGEGAPPAHAAAAAAAGYGSQGHSGGFWAGQQGQGHGEYDEHGEESKGRAQKHGAARGGQAGVRPRKPGSGSSRWCKPCSYSCFCSRGSGGHGSSTGSWGSKGQPQGWWYR